MKTRLTLFLLLMTGALTSFGSLSLENAEIEQNLKAATEDLALATSTRERLENKVGQLRAVVPMNADAVKATETYLNEVIAMEFAHSNRLVELQKLSEQFSKPEVDQVAAGMKALEQILENQALPEDVDSALLALDAELEASLAQFDGVLLDKLDEVRTAMDRVNEVASSRATEHAKAAAEAAALLRKMGEDPGVPVEQVETTQTTPSRSGSEASESTNSRQDEDIVARQLREAAEAETDPVLREKLWKEYEVYVNGNGER